MAIDPSRLARIRTRLLAAAVLAVPACGGNVPHHVNERAQEPPTNPPTDGPINERVVDPPPASPEPEPTNKPSNDHINTPRPQEKTSDKPEVRTINQPQADTRVSAPKTVGPPQTINRAPAQAPTVHPVNTPAPQQPQPNKSDTAPVNTPSH